MAAQSLNTMHLYGAMARLETATKIMALISDLLAERRDGELHLTHAGANGLYDLTAECSRSTRDLHDALGAAAEREDNTALTEAASRAIFERGYREGYAVAVTEPGIPVVAERESALAYGVKLGFMCGWREAAEGGTNRAAACQQAVDDALRVAFRAPGSEEERVPEAAPPGPSLTEPVPDAERADLHPQARQSA
ncbi:hypothetical protein [Paramagnetospirillum magneticum]|uniref:Uncharacterized protein n=1 Tax=Paramagnetospirillum magneticum (strain ATCC 700264 / AMB-1) TaxID=342108 RepID=Q2W6I6_PARM1|nr:hypothetical protein [Paramagnetospirillum magneticum]BAE50539.1 hypothetical protein amb1735 [Paramagnetospirillum magneticum AMB-1]